MPTPTGLRAALREACDLVLTYDGGVTADKKLAQLRALADAPPTVAELLVLLPVNAIGDRSTCVVWTSFDGAETRARRTGAFGLRIEERGSDGQWRHAALCHPDLTAPARLVEVTP